MGLSEFVLKIAIAGILGILIGLERELKHKPVGLKTSFVIAIASCLLTFVSIEASKIYAEAYVRPMDPLRLAAQVVSGIGFLGAGVILRRSNDVISGLTTAAMIWAASGIGIAVGAGFYYHAAIVTVIILTGIQVFPSFVAWIGPKTLQEKALKAEVVIKENYHLTDILKQIKSKDIVIKQVKIKDLKKGEQEMAMRLLVNDKRYTTDVYYGIREIEGILKVDVESL